RAIKGEQFGLDEHDSRRVSVDAIFEGDNRRSPVRPRLVLDLVSLDGIRFVGFYEDASGDPPEIAPGTTVRVTGVLRADTDPVSPKRRLYRILIAAPSDLTVLGAPPWWTSSRIAWALAIASVLGLLSLMWNWSLRSRVHRQT